MEQLNPDLVRQWLPIGISSLSLAMAGIALGWNIYRDVILKARVVVRFFIVSIVTPGPRAAHGPKYLDIRATNHGPGKVQITGIAGRIAPWWRRLIRRPEYFVILSDHTNPLNRQLPVKLEVGDTVSFYLPYDRQCFLSGNATDIGLTDSFGRELLAPRKDVMVARAQFKETFPAAAKQATDE